MKVVLEGHDEEYVVHSLALLFLPVSSFKEEDGKYALSRLWQDGEKAYCFTQIEAEGKQAEAICEQNAKEAALEKFIPLIGRSFYQAGHKLTGLRPPWGTLTGIRPAKRVGALMEEGKSEEEIVEIFSENFYTLPEKTKLCFPVEECEKKALKKTDRKSVSLYLSIPFCPTRCSYCSFVSAAQNKAKKLMPKYVDQMLIELEHTVKHIAELGLSVKTVYVGGGTPTALDDPELQKLMDAINAHFSIEQLLEFSVEAGRPDTVTESKLRILKEAGVSRISINPQTLNDRILEEIGRRHTVKQFFDAFALARKCGFDNINTDLIAGLPTETVEEFRKSVDGVIELGAENITIHTLAVKRAARLRESGAELIENRSHMVGEMVDYSQHALEKAGYSPYYLYRQKNMLGNFENVGYTKPGKEGLYNIYIMGELHSIFGVGAGATAKFVHPDSGRIERIYNPKYPFEYLDRFSSILENQKKFSLLFRENPF